MESHMMYYFFPTQKFNEGKINLIHTKFQLGDAQFKNFWSEEGLSVLGRILNESPDMLTDWTIMDESKRKYEVKDFLEVLSKLTVITQ